LWAAGGPPASAPSTSLVVVGAGGPAAVGGPVADGVPLAVTPGSVVIGPVCTVPVDPEAVFPPPIWTVPIESVAELPPVPVTPVGTAALTVPSGVLAVSVGAVETGPDWNVPTELEASLPPPIWAVPIESVAVFPLPPIEAGRLTTSPPSADPMAASAPSAIVPD